MCSHLLTCSCCKGDRSGRLQEIPQLIIVNEILSWFEYRGRRPSSIVVPRHVFLCFTDRGLGFLSGGLHSLGEFVDCLQARGVLSQLEAHVGDSSRVQ